MSVEWRPSVLVASLVTGGLIGSGCAPDSSTPEGETWFQEVSKAWGIDFRHTSGERRWLFPEIMSGGVALFDYDGDGRVDVYLVQGGAIEEGEGTPSNRLYRNLGQQRFEDVTEQAGVGDRGFGMGAAVGDFDADGDLDLYVTNLGRDVLYRNEGGGRFESAGDRLGLIEEGWGTSAAWLDYDSDGDLDLFIARYVDWSPETEAECFAASRAKERDYCSPRIYDAPASDRLWRNDGPDGFVDVSAEVGIAAKAANGLGVVWGDFDRDGRLDLYVANDATPNHLWLQTEAGRFEDQALLMGCALGGMGEAQAGMGVQAVDLEGDGDLDLLLAHLRGEANTVYRSEGDRFIDGTASLGLGSGSRTFTGFGLGALDFNGDGALDLYVANGHVLREDPLYSPKKPYAQPDQLWRGTAEGGFEEVFPRGGTLPERVESSRGAAFGDLDQDGDVDAVVVNQDASVHVLENRVGDGASWLSLRLFEASGVEALGALAMVRYAGGQQQRRLQRAFGYQASQEGWLRFGLGKAAGADEVRVRWSDGTEESFGSLEAGKVHILRRGENR